MPRLACPWPLCVVYGPRVRMRRPANDTASRVCAGAGAGEGVSFGHLLILMGGEG